MATTETVKQQVAARQNGGAQANGGQAPARKGHGHTLLDTLEAMKPQIARALPSMVAPERFIRVALTTLRRTPKLLECTPESVLGGLMQSAQLGLEPGPLGHAYLVPFWNSKQRCFEAQWILGYTGIIDLARRSGSIETVIARAVYEADRFDVEYGLDERLEHKPDLKAADRGELLYTYAIAKYVGGGHNFVVLGRGDIEKAKQQSQTGRKDKGPWVEHFEPMALKTAVRRLRPFLPLSVEMRDAFGADEQTRLWTGDGDVIDVAAEPEPAIEAGQPAADQGDDDDAGDAAGAPAGAHKAGERAEASPSPAPHPADEDGSGSDTSDEEPKQEPPAGPLSKSQYAHLRELGYDDEARGRLIYAATDGRTRTSKELTRLEQRRVMRAAAAVAAGALVLSDGPDDQPTFFDGDGAVVAADGIDQVTWGDES